MELEFFLAILISCKLYSQSPVITGQPDNLIGCVGDSAFLKILASGGEPLTYQWYKDSIPIPGANLNELVFSPLQVDDEGVYFCRVYNALDSIDSYLAQVLVADGIPQINSISTGQSIVCIGGSNSFTASCTGDYISTRWFRDSIQVGIGTTLNINNAQEQHEGNYWCITENVCGSAYSDTSLFLEIVAPAQILTQPQTQTVCEGEDVTWTIDAAGDYLYYIWLKNGILITSEQTNSITIPNVTVQDTDSYRIVVYNLCNQDTSLSVYINVNTAPNISGQPLSSSGCEGSDLTLYAYASSTLENSYQWYNTETGIIEGADTTRIDINYQANDSTGYYCIISNTCGTVTTDTAIITTKMPPIIIQQPVGLEVCEGDNVSLMTKAAGTEPLFYQWLRNDVNVYGDNISGAQSNELNITDINPGQEGWYKCHVSNECGVTETDEVFVAVNTNPVLLEQIEDIAICQDEELIIPISVDGSEPISFEWHNMGNSEIISTSADLQFDSTLPENSGEYYCLISNMCETISTDTIFIEVKASVEITSQPQSIEACIGDYIELNVTATGAEPIEFLWYRNGSAVSSQTSENLIISDAQINQTGEYFCRVMNECGYVDSEIATVSIGSPPVITWNPVGFDLCELDTLNLIMDAQGDNYNLQWYHNNAPIAGATDTVLNIPLIHLNHSGIYYCLAFNGCATVSTDTVEIEIFPAPTIDLGNDIDICEGEVVNIGTEENFQHYNWNNGFSYQPNITVNTSGMYILEVTAENNCKNRDTINITFHPYHNIMLDGNEIIACGPYELNAGPNAYAYSWNTGAQTQTITVTQTGTYTVTTTGDYFGCSNTASVFVEVREPVYIDLGPDISTSVDSMVNIGVQGQYQAYYWNTGYTGPILSVYGSVYGVGTHTFWLTVTGYNGCFATDTINVIFTPASNIKDAVENLFLIYPNPATEFINIKSDNIIKTIELYNLLGVFILKQTVNNTEYLLKINNFAPGQYILKITDNSENSFYTKIVINKQ